MDNWWKEAVIYQIYPRSFLDTSGNGVGDLNGITEKLKYISDLGVDAIWLSPFFTSPMRDMGYDVSNYTSVDPLFGEMHDFERLISIAHENKLKVIIDQVLSHSSDQLEAFKKSKKVRIQTSLIGMYGQMLNLMDLLPIIGCLYLEVQLGNGIQNVNSIIFIIFCPVNPILIFTMKKFKTIY